MNDRSTTKSTKKIYINTPRGHKHQTEGLGEKEKTGRPTVERKTTKPKQQENSKMAIRKPREDEIDKKKINSQAQIWNYLRRLSKLIKGAR
jgi:hypothetical protein